MILSRFEAIEVPVPAASTLTRFYFPDQPNLRNAMIQGIQIYYAEQITATPLTGSTPVTIADMRKSFITLYSGDLGLVNNLPLLALSDMSDYSTVNASSVFNLPNFQNMIISWTKCYISLPTALATPGVAYSFGVYYKLPS